MCTSSCRQSDIDPNKTKQVELEVDLSFSKQFKREPITTNERAVDLQFTAIYQIGELEHSQRFAVQGTVRKLIDVVNYQPEAGTYSSRIRTIQATPLRFRCNEPTKVVRASLKGSPAPWQCQLSSDDGSFAVAILAESEAHVLGVKEVIVVLDFEAANQGRKLEFPVRFRVSPDLEFFPSQVVVLTGRRHEKASKEMAIRSRTGQVLQLKTFESTVSGLVVKQLNSTAGDGMRLQFAMPSPLVGHRRENCELTIVDQVGFESRIQVPIQFDVAE